MPTRLLQLIKSIRTGDHICSIYENRDQQFSWIIPFLKLGLQGQEKCLYMVDETTVEEVKEALRKEEVEVEKYVSSGQLDIVSHNEAYLKKGYFDPDEMIDLLRQNTDRAIQEGYKALRIAGEMTWVLKGLPGSERLLEYEAKLNHFFPQNPALAICQYDRNKFPAHILLDVLKTHPLAIVGDLICKNLYYVPPDEFLSRDTSSKELERYLNNIQERARLEQDLLKDSEELEKRIQVRTRELSALYAITSTVSSSLDLNRVLNNALDKALETTRAQMGALYLIDDERKYLSLTAHRGYPSEFLEETTRIELSSGNGLIEKVAISGKPAIIGDTSEHPDVGKTTLLEARSLAVIPLRSGGRVLGVLELVSRKRHNFPPEEAALLSAIGDQIGIAVDNARLFEETRRFSVTDALTGVYNRHYLNQMFEREIKRAKRQNTKLSVLMADIDDLKYYNDRFGHLVGDEILKEIAWILAKTVRETDVVTRYGGDEFLILMPDTDEPEAHVALSRIDKALEEWNRSGGFEGTTVNLSMGVKTADRANLDGIIKAADEEMYRRKRRRISGCAS